MTDNELVYNLLSDYQPHNTVEILHKVYMIQADEGIARPGARVNDLKHGKWKKKIRCVFLDEDGSILTGKRTGWKDEKNPKVYWYWLRKPDPIQPLFPLPAPKPTSNAELWAK